MEVTKDFVFDVSYNEKEGRLEFKRKKQSRLTKVIKEHSVLSMVVAFTVLFSAIDVVLLYQFVSLLAQL